VVVKKVDINPKIELSSEIGEPSMLAKTNQNLQIKKTNSLEFN
jgi:hypothetical protein